MRLNDPAVFDSIVLLAVAAMIILELNAERLRRGLAWAQVGERLVQIILIAVGISVLFGLLFVLWITRI